MTDEDRERAVRDLTRHCGEGRLTLDELEERITEVYAATTPAQLARAFRELPSFRIEPAEPVHRDDPPRRTTHPSRRARAAAPGRCGVGGMAGGPPVCLIALIAVLFVTAHFFWAVLLLLIALPKRVQRTYARV